MKKRKLTTATIGIFWLLMTNAAMGQRPSLISFNSAGTGTGNGVSESPALSSDGRLLAFSSRATDLVSNDTNGAIEDVFVRDALTNTTTLVSINTSGTGSGNGASFGYEISDNGRFVAFISVANDLVPSDDSLGPDIYIRDLVASTTTRIRASNRGLLAYGIVYLDMTPDGRYVAFSTNASDITRGDNNRALDVFVYDVSTSSTSLVSAHMFGYGTGNSDSGTAVISDNGRFVAFASFANDLLENDNNGTTDVFVRDLIAGVTTLVSVNYAGTESGDRSSHVPKISADGRKVAFISTATNIVSSFDATNGGDIFVRDLVLGSTALVSVSRRGRRSGNSYSIRPDISANGRFVFFTSWATDLTRANPYEGPEVRRCDLFVRDLELNLTRNLTADIPLPVPEGTQVFFYDVSSDGQSVVFDWYSPDSYRQDVYFGDVATGKVLLMNINLTGVRSAGISKSPATSADGRTVAFVSNASDLVLNDTNTTFDVFTFTPTKATETIDNALAKHQPQLHGNKLVEIASRHERRK